MPWHRFVAASSIHRRHANRSPVAEPVQLLGDEVLTPCWIQVNTSTSLLLAVMLGITGLPDGFVAKATILGLALLRTLVDYGLSWRFYAGLD